MDETAYKKLVEAKHFLSLMKADWSSPTFQYNLSALLGALFSCTEHNRLFDKDPRFSTWYQQAKETYFNQPELVRLRDLRNKETHHKGTETWQEVFTAYPRPIGPEGAREVKWSIDLSSPQQTQEVEAIVDGQQMTMQVEKRYVFDTPASEDVMTLCERGIAIIEDMMKDYTRMRFSQ